MKQKVAFLGLGVMGGPMAGHLAKAGHHVTVYNRTRSKAEQWQTQHAQWDVAVADSPASAAQQAEFIFACVGNDHDLREVTVGPSGAFHAMPKGGVFVDHTTASAEIARELGVQAQSMGITFLDAPVSGGQAGAVNATLTVMVGGDQAAFDRTKPVAMAFSKAFTRVGDNGCGQLAKMVNQICVAGAIQGLAEGIAFGMRAGIDMKLVLEIISKGAAQSWQMEHRGPTMVDDKFDFGFAVDWMRKDLGLCLDEAKQRGALLPITALIDQFYGDVQRMGGQRWDTSSLIKRLR
ncbi:MAG: NAD(P)-dependent oxidoreductase [Burkholderiaceae bacterium]|nr:NAD(P)-dependent oxidoreductase [Burkholderiaceae bacterium]